MKANFCTLVVMALASAASAQTEVTIYNQGFGFIKEVRTLNLKAGRQSIAIEDVAQLIETNSVGIRSLTTPTGLEVLEQNYQFDLINPLAILNKSVGKTIRLNRVLPNGSKESIEGTLISSPTAMIGDGSGGSSMTWNGMVLRTPDGRILLNPSGEVEVMAVPEGLISKPTLLWDLIAETAGANKIELSYLTKGMNWNADYVLTMDGKGKADLKGWVTLVNNCGATFADANLKLLAGDVNRVQNFQRNAPARGGAMEMKADGGFQEESLFEYHLYTLQRPTTIRNNEQKQVTLLDAFGFEVKKKLIIDSMMHFGVYYPGEGEVGTGVIKPQVRLEFVNSKANKLGMPLPMGNVKVYQRDASGSLQMLGEDRIQHTPKDEKLSLVVGQSFDVVAGRKRLSYRRLTDRSFEEVFEVELRNRKEVSETVHVMERHYGDWSVKQSTDKFEKLDSTTQQYVITLKPNEVKKVVYTVVTKW